MKTELLKEDFYMIRHKPSGRYAHSLTERKFIDPLDMSGADLYAAREDAEEAMPAIARGYLYRDDTERVGLDALEIIHVFITIEEIS